MASTPNAAVKTETFLQQRLLSLDVYRGLIMITLAFSGFGLAQTARRHVEAGIDPDFWGVVWYQMDHVEWAGCAYWDLIQPSFMFMVGAAMAFSYSKRKREGQSYLRMFGHAFSRSLILIFLGIFLISNGQAGTNWNLMNVLTQIGLGYTFLFLLWNRPVVVQALAAAAILVGTWFLYSTYPHAGIDIEKGAPEVGISRTWAQEHLKDIPPAWHKSANVGQDIDLWLLNLDQTLLDWIPAKQQWILHALPPKPAYRYNNGGYQTINFLPSLATMLFGLMAGELLRSTRSHGKKLFWLVVPGLVGMGIGIGLEMAGVCPIVKRIWTPSWALFSTGWCCLILAGLYVLADMNPIKFWTFPIVVVGVNSIAIYCMGQMLSGWAARTWQTHLGADIFTFRGSIPIEFEPMVRATMVGFFFWLICLWMYRQKIFVRI